MSSLSRRVEVQKLAVDLFNTSSIRVLEIRLRHARGLLSSFPAVLNLPLIPALQQALVWKRELHSSTEYLH